MVRDVIDSLMAGGLLSFLPIWIRMTVPEQLAIAAGLAVLCYIVILFFKREKTNERKNS